MHLVILVSQDAQLLDVLVLLRRQRISDLCRQLPAEVKLKTMTSCSQGLGNLWLRNVPVCWRQSVDRWGSQGLLLRWMQEVM